MKVYLANGLFSIGDRLVNDVIARELRQRYYIQHGEKLNIYVPQENDAINDKNSFADSQTIALADSNELLSSDILVAIIDGVEIDAGVSAEIGMFSTTGKPIIALYSDVRQQGTNHPDKLDILMKDSTENQFMYRNLFVIGLIKNSGGSIHSDILGLVKSVTDKMK